MHRYRIAVALLSIATWGLTSCSAPPRELLAPLEKPPGDPSEPRDLSHFFDDLDQVPQPSRSPATQVSIREFLEGGHELQSAYLEIREVFTTDVSPPGGGAKKLVLEASAEKMRWAVAEAHRFGGHSQQSKGEVKGTPGPHPWVTACRALCDSGWLKVPEQWPNSETEPMASHGIRLRLWIHDHVTWASWDREIPLQAPETSQRPLDAAAQLIARYLRQ